MTGCSVKYDGKAHGVSVNLSSVAAEASVEYATAEDGPFVADSPTLTDSGTLTVWCRTSASGSAAKTEKATITVSKRHVTLTSGSASKIYDGLPVRCADIHVGGDGFVDGEGAAYLVTGSQTVVGESTNTFTYTLNANTKASNYTISTTFGTLTVTKATLGGGGGGAGGEEPGDGAVAEGGLSKFDVSTTYDGLGHTVDTNALVAAFRAAKAGELTVEYATGASCGDADASFDATTPPEDLVWAATAPAFTNAGDYVVWYRVSSPNYTDFAHAAKVAIAKRAATIASGDGAWTYDGAAHSNATVSAEGFVDGEGVVPRDFTTIVDAGEKPNAFDYDFLDGTLAANYAVTCATGTLAVAAADLGGWTDAAKWAVSLAGDGEKYDGAERTCRVTALSYDGFAIPSFTVSGNAATDAGNYTLTVAGAGNFAGTHSVPWSILPRTVTLTSGSASKIYDGLPVTCADIHVAGDGFAPGEGATYDVTGSQTVVGESANTFDYALDANTKASNYTISTTFGTLAVTKATLGGGGGGAGGEEPGDGAVAEDGLSKFDVAVTYDGLGHTVDTNALVAAFRAAMVGDFAVEYAVGTTAGRGVPVAPQDGATDDTTAGGGAGRAALPDDATWTSFAPSFTNAGEYVFWYRVASPNYTDFAHAAKVAIAKRAATIASGDGAWTYDGAAHSNATLTAAGFVDGEGVVPRDFATIVDAGEKPNAFDYDFLDGTLAANYAVTCATGTLAVAAADLGGWTDAAKWSVTLAGDGEKYDGAERTCRVTALSYGGFAIQSFTVSGNAATDAGNYTLTVAGAGNFAGTHSVPWSILPRTVTLTSGSAGRTYDGLPVTCADIHVGGDGFAPGEGATYDVTGSQTAVGESANTFTYTLNENTTKASNYTVSTVCGTLAVTPATLDADAVFGGCETDAEGRLVCERVYNGAPRPFVLTPDFGEPCRILYALAEGDESAYSETAPTRTHVAEGDLVVFFKLVSTNYVPHYGTGVLRIAPKALEAEMVVADEDAAWFFDGAEKKPSVTVVDGNPNIASTNDWTVAYSDRTGAGLFPVTVTGTNDYRGTVTKAFAILKRPVAPPVIPSKAYSGSLQRPSVPSDARWTLVANPGGTDAGDYSNVVLRLASPEDYRWKGLGEDETDWTGVFTIRRGANGWSVYPGISSWTNGVDAAGEPQGRPRFGTLSVAYRRRGAPAAEETSVRPSAPGRYTARFWVEETANYAGVALSAPYEIDFEVFPGPDDPPAGAATATTPVPVPLAWLEPHAAKYGAGDCEAAANAAGANGVPLWQSYVAGLDPDDPDSRLVALISVGADGVAHVAWAPDLSAAAPPRRYTVLGKARLGDAAWTPVTDANRAGMRFFKVRVEME